MLNNIRRILFRDKRGIALASVMIIFIVAVILVTGISTAIAAQANIIKSRESVSQAHYYAYSAVNSVLTALENNNLTIKKDNAGYSTDVTLKVNGNNFIVPTKIYPDETTPNRFKIVSTATFNKDTAISEVYFDLKDESTSYIPGENILSEFKAPLAYVDASAITIPKGIVIDGKPYAGTEDGLDEINEPDFDYKWTKGTSMPTFKIKKEVNPRSDYTVVPNDTTDSIVVKVKNNKDTIKNVFYDFPNTDETVSWSQKASLDNVFIYAPYAKKIDFSKSIESFNKIIIYAPDAELFMDKNQFANMNGFIYTNSIKIDKVANSNDFNFEGIIITKEILNVIGNDNKDFIFNGAVLTQTLNITYTSTGGTPTVFNSVVKKDNPTYLVDTYLKGYFDYSFNGSTIIVDDGTGGGGSVKYVIDKDSIVYKK